MIDLRRLREEPEYRAGIERKRVAPGLLDEVVADAGNLYDDAGEHHIESTTDRVG